MTSQAERKRRRRERNRIMAAKTHGEAETLAAGGQVAHYDAYPAPEDNRPTSEARSHGSYVQAEDSRTAPWVNRHVDMIGRLGAVNALTPAQVEAARLWQEIHAAYLAELGVAQGRSCLDISAGGHDGSDGNPAAMTAYRSLVRRIGTVHSARLCNEVDKGPHEKPGDLPALRRALDAVNG